MIEHRSPISGIAAFKNEYIATAGYDNQTILWKPEKKEAIALSFHDHLANQCRFSPCGKYLATASSDYTARLFQLPEMKLLTVFSDHQDDVEMVVFHPTKPFVATASRDFYVRVFDFSGNLFCKMVGHTADVISVEWLANSFELISSSDDGTVKHWNVETGELIRNIDCGGIETDTIAISPDGCIFAGNDEGEILIIQQGQTHFISAHQAGIKRLVYNSKQNVLVSLSYDRSFKLWSFLGGSKLQCLISNNLPNIVWPRSCDFFGESKLVFATFGSSYAEFDYKTSEWNLEKINPTLGVNAILVQGDQIITVGDAGIVKKNQKSQQKIDNLCNFLLDLEGSILTGGQDGTIYDVNTGEKIYEHRSPLNCGAVFERKGSKFAIVGTYTGEGIVLQKNSNGKIVFVDLISLHNNAIKGIACSGQHIFSVCATGAAAYHSSQDFSLVKLIEEGHSKIANGCAFLGEGRFASIGRDLKLRIWKDFQSTEFTTPHTHSIKCIAASQCGNYICSGNYYGSISIFHLPTQKWVFTQRVTRFGISSLVATEKKGFLAAAYDGEIYPIQSELFQIEFV